MAASFSYSFFGNVFANAPLWKKVSVGAGVAAASGMVGAEIYNRQRNGFSIAASLSDEFASFMHSNSRPNRSVIPFACLSPLSVLPFTEPKTGVSFPVLISPRADAAVEHQLAGVGLRKKSLFGLKNITVYAFGVYANEASLMDKLGSKYTGFSFAELKQSKSFQDDVVASDFDLTVRLVIVYGRLKVGSVRTAFEESIGSRIKKFSGKEDRPLLESFTSLFSDDIKLPKGTIIDVTRKSGHILATKIDGKEIGAVQSSLLSRAFVDLYIGDEPFDVTGKDDISSKLASLLSKE